MNLHTFLIDSRQETKLLVLSESELQKTARTWQTSADLIHTILQSRLVCIVVLRYIGSMFLTRLWLFSESWILIAFYYIYSLFLWRFLHGWLSRWNRGVWRGLSSPYPFSIRCHWNIFRTRSFLSFPIQFGYLHKLCSQHFSTLCRKDTVF